MQLAADEITIRLDGETVFLRPTLRAATRLERRYGFPKLMEAVAEGNLTIIADVIRESGGEWSNLLTVIERISGMGLRKGLEALTAPLLAHVGALAGLDPSDTPAEEATGERMTFADYHAQLFRIATGWLGWTPETAWNATAAEILEAHKGRVEMLKAIYGAPSDEPGTVPREHTEEEVREGIETLKMLVGRGANVVRR
ncbi:MAG: hypothetical protein IT534_10415 [Bauldia sp.]|nr:hypothetical protein [Bauldia sp.]